MKQVLCYLVLYIDRETKREYELLVQDYTERKVGAGSLDSRAQSLELHVISLTEYQNEEVIDILKPNTTDMLSKIPYLKYLGKQIEILYEEESFSLQIRSTKWTKYFISILPTFGIQQVVWNWIEISNRVIHLTLPCLSVFVFISVK